MASTAHLLFVCCLYVVVGLGALLACGKTAEITVLPLTAEHPPIACPGPREEQEDAPANKLRRKLNPCRNYLMGEASKPADLNGVMKLCAEKKVPLPDKDPWGNALIYEPDPAGGNKFRLFSAGPDGQPNTPDDILHSPDVIR